MSLLLSMLFKALVPVLWRMFTGKFAVLYSALTIISLFFLDKIGYVLLVIVLFVVKMLVKVFVGLMVGVANASPDMPSNPIPGIDLGGLAPYFAVVGQFIDLNVVQMLIAWTWFAFAAWVPWKSWQIARGVK